MSAGTGLQERKTWMIFLGVVLGIPGVLIVAAASAAWYFALGLLLLGGGIFFLVMGIRSGLKAGNPTLAMVLIVALLVMEVLLIVWFLNVFIAVS